MEYPIEVFWVDEDNAWFAVSPSFGTAVSAFGDTADEAVTELQVALEAVVEVFEEDGVPLPTEHSGKIALRIPRSLHAQLTGQARVEGVSLNMLLVSYLSQQAGRGGQSAAR